MPAGRDPFPRRIHIKNPAPVIHKHILLPQPSRQQGDPMLAGTPLLVPAEHPAVNRRHGKIPVAIDAIYYT